ncbi:MAG TPA: 50S ribosomal protein L21 [Candidatus Pacebacteria bacterium]|nr:50S ribosomal protein L21 [Candidatus Paceibacterota bacterium]
MSKYAIIQLQGKQLRVSENDKVIVDRVETEPGKILEVSEVLLVVDGDQRQIGQPLVAGAKVSLKVESHGQGEKLRVFKYKSKSRYRRTQGHRQQQSTLTVAKIAA